MKTRIPLLALFLASPAAAQELNRLDLHNGSDVLLFLNSPFEGAPVSNFDPTGDLYWKVFPADALRRCDGGSNLTGLELAVFDVDFFSTEALWAYTITEGTAGSDGTIQPAFSGAGVFVPGTSTTGTIFGSAGCSAAGYLSGWIYTETFVDTATSLPVPLIEDMTSDGTVDWVFTHYFPAPGFAGHDPLGTTLNSCGVTGDATLQFLDSGDYSPLQNSAENQPDWTGLGNSIYAGFNVGGAGTFAPISAAHDSAPSMAFFFDEPTLTVRTDASTGDGFGLETGVAALNTPLQISSGGVPGPGTTTLGVRLHSDGADTAGSSILLTSLNVGPTLLDLGFGCVDLLGGDLGLNPADPAFGIGLTAMGLNSFVSDPAGPTATSAFADSNQVPAGTGPAWFDLELHWQGFEVSLLSTSVVGSSQVFTNTMRFNDGL